MHGASNIEVVTMKFVLILITWSIQSATVYASSGRKDFNVILEWKQLDFDYPTPAERQADIDSGNFNIGKLTPIDIDVHYAPGKRPRLFITVPKTVQSGVPASLGTVSSETSEGGHLIAPYPSWRWHKNLEECRSERIVSVFRIMIDECDRLWILDSGKINETQTCPAQLLAFDVKTDQLLRKYEIPSNQLPDTSLLVTPIVEVVNKANRCRNTFVYSADCEGFNLLVYDFKRNLSWTIHDETFYPDPDYKVYNISGTSFELMDGILGMSLTPKKLGENRRLFYHAMSSGTENWAYTKLLRNQTIFRGNPEAAPHIFNTYRKKRRTQSAAEAIDNNGILFYGLLGNIEIACTNTHGEYGASSSSAIVGNNKETMQFPGGMKVINNSAGKQELWTLTSRFQRGATGTLNASETNFRILAANVDELTANTPCKYNK